MSGWASRSSPSSVLDPGHTITFSIPIPDVQITLAAIWGVMLGLILGLAMRRNVAAPVSAPAAAPERAKVGS